MCHLKILQMNKSIDFLKYELAFESIYADDGGF